MTHHRSAATVSEMVAANAGPVPGANGGRNFTAAYSDKDFSECRFIAEDQPHSGSAIRPVRVFDGDDELAEGVDYSIEYRDNTDVGPATFTAKGIGSYAGELSGAFSIEPYILEYSFDDDDMTALVSGFRYADADPIDLVVPQSVSHGGASYAVAGTADGTAAAHAFSDVGGKLRSVALPQTATRIGNFAFCDCSALVSVDMPGVTSIGESAFMRCAALPSLDLGDRVTKLGGYAFGSCTSLKTVTGLAG